MKTKKKRIYPKRIKKPDTADDMFRLIRNFMRVTYSYSTQTRSDERRKLWDVMTALRGPDHIAGGETRYADKSATTAVIRYKLVGIDTEARNYADIFNDSSNSAIRRRSMNTVDDHFTRHAKKAFDALGLEWAVVNKP